MQRFCGLAVKLQEKFKFVLQAYSPPSRPLALILTELWPGSENRRRGKLQGILREAPGWLGGTGSEWRGSLLVAATTAHNGADTRVRGGEARVL
jgi:hypothetical protein